MIHPPRRFNLTRAVRDLLALGALGALALFAAGFLLHDDVFIFGDHPGHYWVMWHVIHVAIPQHARPIDWMPDWYAGYPELQFYPPGFALLGWLIHVLGFGLLPTALVYEIVVFIAFALPAFTFYYALRRLQFGVFAAFIAGLFGLVFTAFFDGAVAVWIGMLGSRLAWGLNALVFVWAIDLVEERGARFSWLTALVIAAQILAHPYHLLGILFAVGIYTLCVVRRLPLLHSAARLATVVIIALALDAFWLAPLIAHASTQMIPLIRSTLDQTWRILTDVALLPYAFLALLALARAWRERDATRRAVIIALAALCGASGVAMLGTHALLIERLHVYQLDPVRLVGEFYFPLLLLAAIGASQLADWISRLTQSALRHLRAALRLPTLVFHRGAVAATAVALIVMSLIPFIQSSAPIYPRANGEPRFLNQATRDYRLNELWDTLRATEGRVLFTSYKTHLTARGGEPLPTTLPSLTPLFAERQMMGGTFSAWSPIAALMSSGTLNPPALWGLSEDQDDHALFGIPLEKLSDEKLFEYCARFNITTIVASVNDFRTRTFLDASLHFQSYFNNDFFFVYRVNGYTSAWFDTRNATIDLLAMRDDRIEMRVRAARADAQVTVKVAAYPLWRAHTDTGQPLPITRDSMGLMQIALPPGENYALTLHYEPGAAEHTGNVISLASVALFGIGGIILANKRGIVF